MEYKILVHVLLNLNEFIRILYSIHHVLLFSSAYRPPSSGSQADVTSSSSTTFMHPLPRHLFEAKFGQKYAPFGAQYITSGDGVSIGVESCEEVR
jgi:hypothetical protein